MSKSAENWVWDHSETNGNDRLLLIYLADQADDDGASCYPSIDRLAAKARVSRSVTIRTIARLEERGEIVVVRPSTNGRGRFNQYVLRLGRSDDDPDFNALIEEARLEVANRDLSATRKGRDEVGERRRQKVRKGPQVAVNPDRPLDLDIDPERDSVSLSASDRFAEFWSVYPLKAAPGAARPKWNAAIKKVSPDEIIAGAIRYRDDPNRDPSYTAHPSTWLYQERWNDPPLAARNGRANGSRVGTSMAGPGASLTKDEEARQRAMPSQVLKV